MPCPRFSRRRQQRHHHFEGFADFVLDGAAQAVLVRLRAPVGAGEVLGIRSGGGSPVAQA
jgi:hypothetical protein